MKFIQYLVPALLAGGLALSASAQPAKRTNAQIASYMGPDREALLVQGAKAEGPLTLYYSHPVGKNIAEGFEKKYGLKVTLWRASNEAIMQRIQAEAQAGRDAVDVFFGSQADMELASREGLLEPVSSPAHKDLLPESISPEKTWASYSLDVWTLGYNTRLLKKEDLPKTYEDLLDPKWKGKLAIESGNFQWYGSLLAEMGEEKGKKLFEQITATNGIAVRKGHSLLASLVASGEVPLALTLYTWNPEQLKRRGAPIDSAVLQPLLAHGAAAGVAKKAKNPNVSVLFYDYLLTEGQQIMLDQGYVPMSNKYDAPIKKEKFKLINPRDILKNQDKWVAEYQKQILDKAK